MTTNTRPVNATGGCYCGDVRYEVRGPLRPIVACHCAQCRRMSGHFAAATATRPENFAVTNDNGLSWFQSSASAERGFCKTCGSSLFWRPKSGDRVSIFAGSLDTPTGLELVAHIFMEEASDYYRIDGDVRQQSGGNIDIPISD